MGPHSSHPRFSPILIQNANGPCPLLALVNALVLSTPEGVETALTETLEAREQVSLGLLVDAVFEEVVSGKRTGLLPEDVGELYTFLGGLEEGMNVNPRFVPPAGHEDEIYAARGSSGKGSSTGKGSKAVAPAATAATVGGFEATKELRLYSTFAIPLIHGWSPAPDTEAYAAFARSARTFEDAQNLQFLAPELEAKKQGSLTPAEQQTLRDIREIKSWLAAWPTQLTEYGLERISEGLEPGQFAILFRNEHFVTVYKEPVRGALMTLVTDAGYAGHEEIVWERLIDVGGAGSEMFSGDFRGVSHDGGAEGKGVGRDEQGEEWEVPPALPGPRPGPSRRLSGGDHVTKSGTPLLLPAPSSSSSSPHDFTPAAGRPTSSTEQEDHDLALALQLQEEEEAAHRQADQRRRREHELSERFLSTENVAVGRENPLLRPAIPPRRPGGSTQQAPPVRAPSTSQTPTTTPTSASSARTTRRTSGPDAPPSYEQSASDRVYRPSSSSSATPGQGNPLDAYEALRRQQQQQGVNGNEPSSGSGMLRGGGRRPGQLLSASSGGGGSRRRSSQLGSGSTMPGSFGHVAPGGGMMAGGPSSPGAGGGRQGMGVNGAAGVRDTEEKCVVM